MAKRLTGYIIWQEITRAINANRVARRALQQMIDEKPGPQAMALLVAKSGRRAVGPLYPARGRCDRAVRQKAIGEPQS